MSRELEYNSMGKILSFAKEARGMFVSFLVIIVFTCLVTLPALNSYFDKGDSSLNQTDDEKRGKIKFTIMKERANQNLIFGTSLNKSDDKKSYLTTKASSKADEENAFSTTISSRRFFTAFEKQSKATTDRQNKEIISQNPYIDKYDAKLGDYLISGRVLDETGQPISGIALNSRLLKLLDPFADEYEAENTKKHQAITNANGFYEISEPEYGEYEIYTNEQNGFAKAKIQARSGSSSVDLILKQVQEVWVYGIVENSKGDRLDDVRVFTIGNPDGETYTNTSGEYGFYLPMVGEATNYYIGFKRNSYAYKQLVVKPSDQIGNNSLPLNVKLEPIENYAMIIGSLRDTEGSPIAGESIFLYPTNQMQSRYQTQSDSTGKFTLKNIEPGNGYRIQIQPEKKYKSYSQGNIVLDPGQDMRLQIVLQPSEYSGSLSGMMVDMRGNPLTNFPLLLRAQNIGQPEQIISDDSGYFFIENLPTGFITLESLLMPKFSFTLNNGQSNETKDVDLLFDIGDYTLYGQVFSQTNQPSVMQPVLLTWNDYADGIYHNSMRITKTDNLGYFRFTGVGSGRHKIIVKPDNMLPYMGEYAPEHQQGIVINLKENQTN